MQKTEHVSGLVLLVFYLIIRGDFSLSRVIFGGWGRASLLGAAVMWARSLGAKFNTEFYLKLI